MDSMMDLRMDLRMDSAISHDEFLNIRSPSEKKLLVGLMFPILEACTL